MLGVMFCDALVFYMNINNEEFSKRKGPIISR